MADFGVGPTMVPLPISSVSTDLNGTSLGRKRSVANSDGTYHQQVCLYVPAALQGSVSVSGAPYFVDHGSVIGQHYQASAPAGNASSGVARLCVTMEDAVTTKGAIPTSGTYGWFAFAGKTKALVDGTAAVVAGNFLKVNSKSISQAMQIDGNGATRTTASVAVALAAQAVAGGVMIDVVLLGDPALIA